MTTAPQQQRESDRDTTTYSGFAGRKLVGLVVAIIAMVVVAIGSLSLCAVEMLDGSFATNITITVCSGIATVYATFVGGNYGEHVAKNQPAVAEVEVEPLS